MEKGFYCAQCSKCVIDYRHYSEQQLFLELSKDPKGHCGMFAPQQLEKVYQEKTIKNYRILSSLLLSGFLLSSRNSGAQSEVTIDTTIIAETDTSLSKQDSTTIAELEVVNDSAVEINTEPNWIKLSPIEFKEILVINGNMRIEPQHIPTPFESILDSAKNTLAGFFIFFPSKTPTPASSKNPLRNSDRPLWLESLRHRFRGKKKK